jgi:hypothetical protein
MAETLGSLCDKLTIVKLKQFHTTDNKKLKSLQDQENNLKKEIDQYINEAINNKIPVNKLTYAANKVYKQKGNEIGKINGQIGKIFSELAGVNCQLWHEQEKVYEFEKVPVSKKNKVVKQLALLNLQRNQCIDAIDNKFKDLVVKTS